jgi:hypothetical protein
MRLLDAAKHAPAPERGAEGMGGTVDHPRVFPGRANRDKDDATDMAARGLTAPASLWHSASGSRV